MSDNFGFKIGIEGEKEFKNALKEINQAFKVLGSEMNLVTSMFDRNDKSVQALTSRNQVLNREIDAQKDKIEVLKAALQNSTESFGENDKRTQSWAIQLNNAQAQLNGMERELAANSKALDESSSELDDAGKRAESFGGAVDGVGDKLEGAGKETDAFGKALDGTGDELGEAGKNAGELGKSVDEAGKGMNEAGKETDKFGKEVDSAKEKTSVFGDVLKASLAADAIKAGLSALVSMIKEVGAAVKGYISDGSAMAAAAAENHAKLGQVMRNTMDASDEEIKSIISLTKAQEQLGVVSATVQAGGAQELGTYLTKSATLQQLIPVMNDMVAQQYGVNASQESAVNIATMLGKVMNGQVGALSRYGYTFDKAQEKILKFGTEEQRAAVLAEVVGESVGGMNAALAQTDAGKMSNLNTVLENTKIAVGQAANEMKARILGDMLPSISTLSDAFLGLISGEGSVQDMAGAFSDVFDQITATITEFLPVVLELGGQILTAIVTGIADNTDTIVGGILRVIEMIATSIQELLPMIMETGSTLLFAIIQGIIEALPMLATAAVGMITALATGLGNALPELIPAAVGAIIAIVDFVISSIPKLIEAGIKLLTSLITSLPSIITTIVAAIPQIINGLVTAIIGSIPQLVDSGVKLLVSLIQSLPQIITTVVAAIPQIVSALVTAIVGNIDKIIQAGVQLLVALIQNLPTIIAEIVRAVPQIITGLVNAFTGQMSAIREVGSNLIRGIWNGINDVAGWLNEKIASFFGGVVSKIKNFFGIKSPSTLFAGIGRNLGEGIGVGFEDAMRSVSDDMIGAIPTDFPVGTNLSGDGLRTAGRAAQSSITQNISVVTPKPLSEKELVREFRNLSRKLALEI